MSESKHGQRREALLYGCLWCCVRSCPASLLKNQIQPRFFCKISNFTLQSLPIARYSDCPAIVKNLPRYLSGLTSRGLFVHQQYLSKVGGFDELRLPHASHFIGEGSARTHTCPSAGRDMADLLAAHCPELVTRLHPNLRGGWEMQSSQVPREENEPVAVGHALCLHFIVRCSNRGRCQEQGCLSGD